MGKLGDMLTVCHEPTKQSVELTDEEIEGLWTSYARKTYEVDDIMHNVAKAQLKKVVEWGDEDCPHSKDWEIVNWKCTPVKRRHCDKCWQALLEEIKE